MGDAMTLRSGARGDKRDVLVLASIQLMPLRSVAQMLEIGATRRTHAPHWQHFARITSFSNRCVWRDAPQDARCQRLSGVMQRCGIRRASIASALECLDV